MPRVWIEDEKGKLRLVFIRTGVTDNSYTEVLRGELEKGQLVLTGKSTGDENQSRPSQGRGMMFFRR